MSMLLDLSKLRGGVEHVARKFEPDAFGPANEDFRITSAVTLEADIHKDGQKIRLGGRLRTQIEVVCSRCVDPIELPVDVKLDLLFLPAPALGAAGESEVSKDDLGVSGYADEVLDLAEVVREQLYLALPMKPLCRADCRGLCVVCGVNRNTDVCACEATWIDPRLEALGRLKTQ